MVLFLWNGKAKEESKNKEIPLLFLSSLFILLLKEVVYGFG
jgi:hypothetical protein